MRKRILILSLFFLCIFFCFASFQRTEAVTQKEIENQLSLPKSDAKKILNSLLGALYKEWTGLLSSALSSAQDQAVLVIIRKGVKAHVLDYNFIYVPQEIGKDMLKAVYKTALFVASPTKGEFLIEEIEKLSVKMAIEKATELLFLNNMKTALGELSIFYKSIQGKSVKLRLPYIIVYRPDKNKPFRRAEVSISFFSEDNIPVPQTTLKDFWYSDEYEKEKLPPFVLRIRGKVEKTDSDIYRWVNTPEIEIEYPETVPHFEFDNPGFLRRIIDSLKKRAKSFLIGKITDILFGRLDILKNLSGTVWSIIKSLISKEDFFMGSVQAPEETKETKEAERSESIEETSEEKEDKEQETASPSRPSTQESEQGAGKKEEQETESSLSEIEETLKKIKEQAEKIAQEIEKAKLPKKEVLGETDVCAVDINTASKEELQKIIGVGPVLAQRIIDGRPFSSVYYLINVSGIGEITLQNIINQGCAYVEGTDLKTGVEGEEIPDEQMYEEEEEDEQETTADICPVNINTASKQELQAITGIGPVIAQRIIDARPFLSVYNLTRVSGIGEITLQNIIDQDCAYVENDTGPSQSPGSSTPSPPASEPESEETETEETELEETELEETEPEETEPEPEEPEPEEPEPEEPEPEEPEPEEPEDKPELESDGRIVINEVAWMGTQSSPHDEWIELYNASTSDVELEGWTLSAQDGSPNISLSGLLPVDSFYLLERTDDSAVSDIAANWYGSFGSGGLHNDGEILELKNPDGVVVDRIDCSGEWFDGDNDTKSSMERIDPLREGSHLNNWVTNNGYIRNGKDADGNPINGTPKNINSPLQAPERITDLSINQVQSDSDLGKAVLNWTAPQDHTSSQEQLSYEIRYLIDEPINKDTWNEALSLEDKPEVSSAGNQEQATIWPLNYDRTYYFAVKTNNERYSSPLSNVVSFETGDSPDNFAWPQSGKNARKSAYVSSAGPENINNIEQIAKGYEINDAVIGAHDILYFATDKGIGALTPDLEQKWFTPVGNHIHGLAVLSDGTVIGLSNTLFALDQLGNKIWDFPLSINYLQPPTVSKDKIYLLGKCINDSLGQSTGFSLFEVGKDGKLNWFFDTENTEAGLQPELEFACQYQGTTSGFYESSPAVSGGVVYFGDEKNIYAVSAFEGLKWKTEFTDRTGGCPAPTIGPDNTIYAFVDRGLHAFTPDGTVKWALSGLTNAPAGPVLSPHQKLYFPHRRLGYAWFLILDSDTGQELQETPWRVPKGENKALSTSPALITNNHVYFAGNGILSAHINIHPLGSGSINSFYLSPPPQEGSSISKFIMKPDGILFIVSKHLYVVYP